MASVSSTLRACLRNRPALVALVLVQLLLLLPALLGYPTLSDLAIGQEQAKQTLEILSSGMDGGVYDSAPIDLKDINDRERSALEAAVSAAYPSNDFFNAYARYYDIEIESVKAGYSESDPSLYARSELIHQLASLDNPEVYPTAAKMPATYYLAFVLGLMPGIVLLLPVALLASASQRQLAARTLVSMSPIHRAKKRAASLVVAVVLTIATLIAELAPAVLIAFARNGFGSLDYPVVFIADGAVCSTAIGMVLAKDLALIAAASLVTIALVGAAEALQPHAGLGVSLAFLVAPLLPIYSSQNAEWRTLARHLPSTYLSCGGIVGMPVYANGLDIRIIPGATWELGCTTLLLFAVVLALLALLVDALLERSRSTRLERSFS